MGYHYDEPKFENNYSFMVPPKGNGGGSSGGGYGPKQYAAGIGSILGLGLLRKGLNYRFPNVRIFGKPPSMNPAEVAGTAASDLAGGMTKNVLIPGVDHPDFSWYTRAPTFGELPAAGETGLGVMGRTFQPPSSVTKQGFMNIIRDEPPFTVTGTTNAGVPIGRNAAGGARFVSEGSLGPADYAVPTGPQFEGISAADSLARGAGKGALAGALAAYVGDKIENTNTFRGLERRPTQEQEAGPQSVVDFIKNHAVKMDRSNSVMDDISQTLSGIFGKPSGMKGNMSLADAEAAQALEKQGMLQFVDPRTGQAYKPDKQGYVNDPRLGRVKLRELKSEASYGNYAFTGKGAANTPAGKVAASQGSQMNDLFNANKSSLANRMVELGVDPTQLLSAYDQGVEALAKDKSGGYLGKDGKIKSDKLTSFLQDVDMMSYQLGNQAEAEARHAQNMEQLRANRDAMVLQAYGEYYQPYAQLAYDQGQTNAANYTLKARSAKTPELAQYYLALADEAQQRAAISGNQIMNQRAFAPWAAGNTQSNNQLAGMLRQALATTPSKGGSQNILDPTSQGGGQQAAGGGDINYGGQSAAQILNYLRQNGYGSDIFAGIGMDGGNGSYDDYNFMNQYGFAP